jgi:hypothetical protein
MERQEIAVGGREEDSSFQARAPDDPPEEGSIEV